MARPKSAEPLVQESGRLTPALIRRLDAMEKRLKGNMSRDAIKRVALDLGLSEMERSPMLEKIAGLKK